MSKTPEEMAEEYANSTDSCDVDQEYAFAYKGFLAGYKAAQDQLADVSKVMCNTTMEEIKAVDTGEIIPITNLLTPAKWISVKDRLPDIYQRVLILIRGRVFISSIEEEYGDEYRDGVIRFWDGDWDWPEVTHWMPLPGVEGLKHED